MKNNIQVQQREAITKVGNLNFPLVSLKLPLLLFMKQLYWINLNVS